MNIELNANERRIVLEALARYHRAKRAEKMLTGQAIRDPEKQAAHYASFDRLLDVGCGLARRLTTHEVLS